MQGVRSSASRTHILAFGIPSCMFKFGEYHPLPDCGKNYNHCWSCSDHSQCLWTDPQGQEGRGKGTCSNAPSQMAPRGVALAKLGENKIRSFLPSALQEESEKSDTT
jgi:hypothetical protein